MIDEAERALKSMRTTAAAGDATAGDAATIAAVADATTTTATAVAGARIAVSNDAATNTAFADDASIGQCRCCCTCGKASNRTTQTNSAAAAAAAAAAPLKQPGHKKGTPTAQPFPLAAAKEMVLEIQECGHHQVLCIIMLATASLRLTPVPQFSVRYCVSSHSVCSISMA